MERANRFPVGDRRLEQAPKKMHNARTNGREKGDQKDFSKANCARKLISQQIQECQKLKIVREKNHKKKNTMRGQRNM